MPVSIPMRIVMGNTAVLKEGENVGELHTAMNTLPPAVENESSNCY